MVFIDQQYPYYYTDLFVDEWVIMAMLTALYVIIVIMLSLTINYIRKNEERKKRLVLGCLAIGVLLTIFTLLKKHVDHQEAERQIQLDEAERNGYIIEQQQKEYKQELYKMLYKKNK